MEEFDISWYFNGQVAGSEMHAGKTEASVEA